MWSTSNSDSLHLGTRGPNGVTPKTAQRSPYTQAGHAEGVSRNTSSVCDCAVASVSAGQGLGTLGHWWSCRLREWSRRVSPGRSEATPQVRHRYGPLGHARKMACPFGRRNGGVRRALRAMKSSARRRSSLVATTGNGGYPGRCGKHRFATTQERRDASPAQLARCAIHLPRALTGLFSFV